MKSILLSILLFLMFSGRIVLFGQTSTDYPFTYFSPKPGAEMVQPENNITFRLHDQKQTIELSDFHILVTGSKSGVIQGEKYIAPDSKTLIFRPEQAYQAGEIVDVSIHFLKDKLSVDYHFTVSSTSTAYQWEFLRKLLINEEESINNQQSVNTDALQVNGSDLPAGMPNITITHFNNPSPGYLFMATLDNKSRSNGFLVSYDNLANPVFYRRLPGNSGMDFKIQPNGNLSYYGRTYFEFYEMDPFYDVIDTIIAGNGYVADNHELILLENGHKFLMAYDPQVVDMSLIVPGGNPNATVIGLIIQELNENHEVVFQWRSWDHFQITDASDNINLLSSIIDYVHGNSIELDTDTTMIISSRNMDEVTRINRNTGEVIWRFGGKNNQFTFADSTQLFCSQHDARIMSGINHISIFDNGNCHESSFSSAAEYEIDHDLMTATLINRLRGEPDIISSFLGNTQRLDNGRTIVGWGSGMPSISEFDEEGNIALEFSFSHINYRAFRFNWQSPLILSDADSLNFGTILIADSSTAVVGITNNYYDDIEINHVFFHTDNFKLVDTLPVNLIPGETKYFSIRFTPDTKGIHNDAVGFCWVIHTDDIKQRISRQVFLSGTATIESGFNEEEFSSHFSIYPNPVSDYLNVESSGEEIVRVTIMNNMGQTLKIMNFAPSKKCRILLDVIPGIYFVKITTQKEQNWMGRLIKN